MEEKKLLLTISILVSNRIDTISKCMESIRPLLEQLPSELIVVDTVGEENSDGALAVAKEYATEVVHFDWCNDFSAARNAGLKLARGAWFLFMDDDEWFEDVTEIIEFFRSGEYENYGCATYQIRDYRNREGSYATGILSRMVRLEADTAFCGRVHEYLNPMHPPVKELASFIHHYGYVFDTAEEHKKHSERNLSLLRPEFEKNPNDLRLRLQMVQECMYLKELEEEALVLCRETMKLDKKYHMHPAFQWIMTAYVRLADRNKEWEQVIRRGEELRQRFVISSFTNLAVSIMEIKAYDKLEQQEAVIRILPQLQKAYRFLTDNPQKRQEQSVLDFNVFLEADIVADALQRGITALYKAGDKDQARQVTKERQQILNKPIVSISMLVSNNIVTIRKCMESLQPVLQEVPAELIVVDTVGEEQSDGSLAVAKEYATELVHFDWCDDFAAARNAGMSRAKGEWFMAIDDDEWFEDTSEIVEFFKSGEYLQYNSATYRQRNYRHPEEPGYNDSMVLRMIKFKKGLQYVGTIHEIFSEMHQPCKDFNTFVHHYGYAYVDEAAKLRRVTRNINLLKKELEKNPADMRYRTQMALELSTFDNEQALKFCQETLKQYPKEYQTPEFQWQMSLVFRLYEALGVPAAEAEKTYLELKERYGYSETAENSISFQMARLYLLSGEPTKAYPYVSAYFAMLEYLQQNKKQQQLQMMADFYRYQSREGQLEMLHFGAYCASMAGEYETAWKWYKAIPWEDRGYDSEEDFLFLVELAKVYIKPEVMLDILKRIVKNDVMIMKPHIRSKVSELLTIIKGAAV